MQRSKGRARLAAGEEVGPFHGVPIPVKDLTEAAGQPCFYGSLGMSDRPVETSERVVEQLLAAGFVLMGRTAAPEAGTMTVTETRRFGICHNPWDLSRSPGGSSGGAAAAVAAGLAPVAHASDGGGSIRVPASSCGLVGCPDGLPVGVQLVAGPWQEDVLIRVAASLEEAMPWADRRPQAFAGQVSPLPAGPGTPSG
jgi:amidase